MSPSEPPASGSVGRRRRSSEPGDVPAGRPRRGQADASAAAEDDGQSRRTGGRRRAGGRRKKEARRGRPLLFALAGVLVVALIGVGVVFYLRSGSEEGGSSPVRTRPAAYQVVDSGNMNTVLATREADSRVLNEGELFERRNTEISSQSLEFALRDSDLTEDCSQAVWGQDARDALAAADCVQAGRATYVSDTYFGVAAVFNLGDVEGSRAVAAAMAEPEDAAGGEGEDAEAAPETGFVVPPSGEEPFNRLGEGYSAADAIISGHYLVVVWVQPTGSESVEDRVSLSSPLVALANFRDPLYRRMVDLRGDESAEGTDGTTEGAVPDGTGTTEGTTGGTVPEGTTDGTGTGTGTTDGTGTTEGTVPDGTGTTGTE
ncbi:hypothetical protein [Nocardiopsis sp. YSL2]|uniref:hypothetical protein n=1 Tax=Nocardiopsis sp. YSL2 TaxID=2939492 RepID=UPI0026F42212|nr:hypothetical protein [Nocardiopsis sp. YSL2]